jgi:hypothetical protein
MTWHDIKALKSIKIRSNMYIYIYICVCVCVCVCTHYKLIIGMYYQNLSFKLSIFSIFFSFTFILLLCVDCLALKICIRFTTEYMRVISYVHTTCSVHLNILVLTALIIQYLTLDDLTFTPKFLLSPGLR